MRVLMAPARVTLSPAQQPVAISWDTAPGQLSAQRHQRSGWLRVGAVLDQWRYDGLWWQGAIKTRHYFLLELSDGRVLEAFREEEAWWVARTSD